MAAVGNRQAVSGSDDDSGKDSDEEEVAGAKDKFRAFFNHTKDYWVSLAKKEMKEADEETLEDYAVVLAEKEFFKETLSEVGGGDEDGAVGLSAAAASGSAGAACRRPPRGVTSAVAHSSSATTSSRAGRDRPRSQPPSTTGAPPMPSQRRHPVQALQEQMRRVELDEGID